MNLEAISSYITGPEAALNLREGVSAFVTEMPATCKNGVLLIGPYHGTPINHELRGYVETEFRFVVRSVDYAKGLALGRALNTWLTAYGDKQITEDVLVKRMLPLNDPRPYRRSVGGYWEFEVDVQINYVQTAP